MKVILRNSPEARCLNDLDHQVWKIIGRRQRSERGIPCWGFLGELGKRAEIGGEDALLAQQIRHGHIITVTGMYDSEQLLFAKFPKLPGINAERAAES